MKTLLLIFCLLLSTITFSQTYLKVADKPEYEKYKAWCNTPIQKHLVLDLKIKLQKVGNYYTDPNNVWCAVYPFSVVLVKPGTIPVCEPYEKLLSVSTTVYVVRRIPSVADFYANWVTKKLQNNEP